MEGREIKFRVWDLEDEGMIDAENLVFSSEELEDKSSVFMQYTGQKDRNHQEVYEGDILVYYSNTLIPRVVRWDSHDDAWGAFSGSEKTGYCINPDVGCDFGIIGNIYENPEIDTA